MRLLTFLITLLFFAASAQAQYSFRAICKDKVNADLLDGVSVSINQNKRKGAISGANGLVQFNNLPAEAIDLTVSFSGYKTTTFHFILPDSTVHIILLEPDPKELKNVVVVSATRSNERIENAVTKVEVLGQQELNEESTLKPGNIASILGDVSGVQVQQSSVTTGNANIRIQGLDGRYTQILKDGMPLYGGFAGGFGVLSIPPLDLKQIELIKGSSSTLYGGGAIGGLVNMVSRKPTFSPEASFLINQSTLKETNANVFFAQRWKKIGFSFFAGQTFQGAVDVNKDELTDVPKFSSTLIHPTLFLYPTKKTWLALGWSGNFDNRTGGNINAIEKNQYNSQVFYEKNIFTRHIFTLLSESRINPSLTISVKGSISIFNREETTNTSFFSGKQNNYYAEVSLLKRWHKHTIVAGINTTGDKFSPSISTPVAIGSFVNNVVGIFAQDSWQLLANTKVETGLRLDQHDSYGSFLLPRIAIFQRINKNWGSRAGFGMGYITPNALTPQLRDYAVFQLQPIAKNVTAEKSFAGNVEVNYKKSIGQEGSIFINQAFFITQINDPITGNESSNGNLYFTNQPKPLLTKGFDTYIQLHIPNWEFYIGYTYTEAVRKYLPQNQFVLYTPRNRAAATALFEIENKFRIGLEASYNGYQRREDYSKTPGYLFMAAMAEKKFGPQWSLVFNCENIFDERQSRYESLFTGQSNNPVFKTLWAPIDGRIINVSIRYQPFAKKE